MKDQKITQASLLQSKAKMMADRNERFAVIKEEVVQLEKVILNNITQLTDKIRKVRGA